MYVTILYTKQVRESQEKVREFDSNCRVVTVKITDLGWCSISSIHNTFYCTVYRSKL